MKYLEIRLETRKYKTKKKKNTFKCEDESAFTVNHFPFSHYRAC